MWQWMHARSLRTSFGIIVSSARSFIVWMMSAILIPACHPLSCVSPYPPTRSIAILALPSLGKSSDSGKFLQKSTLGQRFIEFLLLWAMDFRAIEEAGRALSHRSYEDSSADAPSAAATPGEFVRERWVLFDRGVPRQTPHACPRSSSRDAAMLFPCLLHLTLSSPEPPISQEGDLRVVASGISFFKAPRSQQPCRFQPHTHTLDTSHMACITLGGVKMRLIVTNGGKHSQGRAPALLLLHHKLL